MAVKDVVHSQPARLRVARGVDTLANAVKERWPDKTVVAGGPHVKHYLAELFSSAFDYLVPLDGERALARILSGRVCPLLSME